MSSAIRLPGLPGHEIGPDQRGFFLNELRRARLAAQKDSECFDELLFVFERLGMYSLGKAAALGAYAAPLGNFARQSALAQHLDGFQTAWHSPPETLYRMVEEGRNDALHHGAAVRHLTQHAIELALLFEDSLMNGLVPAVTLRDIMVRCPTTAEEWQPVSFVRQVMLTNSFSFLPIRWDGKWRIVSDAQVALFLRTGDGDRRQLLGRTVGEAASEPHPLVTEVASTQRCCTRIVDVLDVLSSHKPILVCEADPDSPNGTSDRLVGIVTAFDVL